MCDNTLESFWKSSLDTVGAINKPLSLASLYNKVGNRVGSVDNLHLVVEMLAYTGRTSISKNKDTTYVKIAMPGDTQKPCITQMEIGKLKNQWTLDKHSVTTTW